MGRLQCSGRSFWERPILDYLFCFCAACILYTREGFTSRRKCTRNLIIW